VAPPQAGIQTWLSQEFASRLAASFEMMAGELPPVQWEAVPWEAAPHAPEDATLRWRQPFSGLDGAVWVIAAEADWSAAAAHALHAAGIQESDPGTLKSTFQEIVGQALSGLEQALTARVGREIARNGGKEEADAPREGVASSIIHLKLGEAAVSLTIRFETALIEAIVASASIKPRSAPASPPIVVTAPDSKTFDLLLEVELPVSVSFGRAQVLLKDVLKLTTGSIVELNRAVSDPVEVIVNNCVIARGEVVVVEGNFGVRIQQIISRQERLRTLD
jgi:flagellar motor switch protein FliN